MRFGVLGPLAVWTSEGRPVRIPEVKVRGLLAELIVQAGRVVPADRLIDHLWSGSLPTNPAASLQTRVSQLRRALEDAEEGARRLVVSRAPGYLLDVPPDALDVGRFQALVAAARTAGTPRARADLLGDALALWRGPALIEFADEEFAAAEIARLDELRLTAMEEQAEARLELGEHAVLAGELGDLVARHPLRERLRAVHLRALYRSGRQSEALDGYRDLRERLADELGVDPGRELAALHEAMLRQDPALEAGPAAPPPGNLPAPMSDLIGRAEAVGEVTALLGSGRLVTLTGPGGVGKTSLALEAARRLADSFPDGAWLVELGALPSRLESDLFDCSAQEVAEAVAAVLGIRDESGALSLAETMRGKRALLVLDNCEHVLAPVAELAGALLRAVPELRIMATSRRPLGVAGERLWQVPPLPVPSAVRLFEARATARTPGFAVDAGNEATVAAICARLDGIPLALELAATRVRALGVHELAARLGALPQDAPRPPEGARSQNAPRSPRAAHPQDAAEGASPQGTLDGFKVLATGASDAPARQRTLRAVIDWSWELLGDDERTVLRRLAVHAGGCTLRAAEAVCGDGRLDVMDLMAGLVDHSLVTVTTGAEPRYQLLESVAAYCRERLVEAGELEEVERRHLRHFTELAVSAEPYLRGPEQREWLARLDAESANLRAALGAAVRHAGAGSAALRLVNALAWYWVLRGRLGEGRRALAAALAAGGDEDAAGTAATWLAAYALRMGEVLDHTDPATRPDDLEGLAGRARAEWFLSLARLGVGDTQAGEEQAERVLELFRTLGDDWGTAAALSTRSRQALLRGDLTALHEYGTQSMALFTTLGDRWGQLHATLGLGAHAEIVGDYESAARLHREGLRMAEELGLHSEVADKLSELGRIALLEGDFAQADELHEKAARLAREQGYTIGQEYASLGLALSARRQGRLDVAEALLRTWLEWDRELNAAIATALILAELGFVAELRGDAEAALALHLEGLREARESGGPRAVALAYEGLAGAHAAAGRAVEAARLLGAADEIRRSLGAPLPPAERGDVDRITAAAVAALGEERFVKEFATPYLEETPTPRSNSR
ncbi:BTAD domain-containing putative transcriptional regulator [Nonomuraea africana]|uniref:ATPase/DNA-binding SARP family transcriptional activator n=1 Tax=Nonomuraea africana TaxID=46171 RepID=A0ABR9KUF1_9ACTN|nr:BTAD domain-containing putative transcriptional regulator [Nonomuraea africana]MBE1565655.1 putative ATPase/DNA-binding SARP family transcriptional activator [Nonomuraea africana]